jgi:hypothetical protein
MFGPGGMSIFERLAPLLVRLIVVDFFVEDFVVVLARASEGFPRQNFDGGPVLGWQGGRGALRLLDRMALIVVFEVFKNVADVQERVAIQANIDEGRLHAWQDASDFAFVNAADEGEFFFALDVDFD